MTASELFTMYRALWAEAAGADTSLGSRIRAWIAANPRAARKSPAERVARAALWKVMEADADRHEVPLGGTYAITFTVTGVDSTVLYARSWRQPQLSQADVTHDSATGVPTATRPTSYAVVMTMSPSRSTFDGAQSSGDICGHLPIVVPMLPIPLGPNSTWGGRLPPTHLSSCGSSTTLREWGRTVNQRELGDLRVIFRRHADGRVTFEGRGAEPYQRGLLVRAVRISTVQDRQRRGDEPGGR